MSRASEHDYGRIAPMENKHFTARTR